jgi:hypothetical protein
LVPRALQSLQAKIEVSFASMYQNIAGADKLYGLDRMWNRLPLVQR